MRAATQPASVRRALVEDGPRGAPEFGPMAAALSHLDDSGPWDPSDIQVLRSRLERYMLTKDGRARQRVTKPFLGVTFATAGASGGTSRRGERRRTSRPRSTPSMPI